MAPTCVECLASVPVIMVIGLLVANTWFYRWYIQRDKKLKKIGRKRKVAFDKAKGPLKGKKRSGRERARDYDEYESYVKPGIHPAQQSTLSQEDQIKYLQMQLQQSVMTIANLKGQPIDYGQGQSIYSTYNCQEHIENDTEIDYGQFDI